MTWYELWLFLHVLGAVVWVGGALVGQVFGVLTKRAADPSKSAFFARSMSFVGTRVFLPAAALVLVSGYGLIETAGWDWSEPFVAVGLLLWALVASVGLGYVARAMGEAGARLEAEGPSPALGLRVRNLVLLSRVLAGVLVVIVFLMTVKPGS